MFASGLPQRARRTRATLRAMSLAVAALAAAGAAPAAATSPFATLKGDRPAWLGPRPPARALDCAGAPLVALHAASDTTLAGDTTGVPDGSSGYSCVAWNETGGEAIFRLSVGEPLLLRAVLGGLSADLDIFLLAACDAATCLAAGNMEFALALDPGEYFLVVDGIEGAAGPFTARLRARPAGVPLSVCAGPDPATAVLCADDPIDIDGTIFEQDNRIEAYDCSPYLEQAGEAWFAVDVPDSGSFTATVSNQVFDAALWVFDGCGPQAVCLAFADAGAGGESESVTVTNDTGGRATFYLAVDGLRPPTFFFDGLFALRIACDRPILVPVESASWGALKARYR